jgi:hypothetical protein
MFNSFQLSDTDGIPAIDNLRVQVRDDEKLGLDVVLGFTRTYQATDPRDRIYALLGLVGDDDRDAIVPDYSIDVGSLYLKIAWHFIKSRETLDFLVHAGHVSETLREVLPSWVPDWSLFISERIMSLDNVSYGAYWADVVKFGPVISAPREAKVLEAKGKRIDTVKAVGAVMIDNDSGSQAREAHHSSIFDQ